MLFGDGVCMLINVVIIDSTQVDLVSHATFFRGIVVIVSTQVKDGLCQQTFFSFYYKSFWMFTPKHLDKFFINVPTWHGEHRALKAFLFQFCAYFYRQKMLVVL